MPRTTCSLQCIYQNESNLHWACSKTIQSTLSMRRTCPVHSENVQNPSSPQWEYSGPVQSTLSMLRTCPACPVHSVNQPTQRLLFHQHPPPVVLLRQQRDKLQPPRGRGNAVAVWRGWGLFFTRAERDGGVRVGGVILGEDGRCYLCCGCWQWQWEISERTVRWIETWRFNFFHPHPSVLPSPSHTSHHILLVIFPPQDVVGFLLLIHPLSLSHNLSSPTSSLLPYVLTLSTSFSLYNLYPIYL